MLTALDKKGKLFSLHNRPENVQQLRHQRFYCPACKEEVVLKAGKIRIPHFSHRTHSLCASTEPESTRHLQGKKDLFAFCKENGFKASLEHYLPEIKQRPDILAWKDGKVYALEYQCTPISVHEMAGRSKGYLSQAIVPVWIAGGRPYAKQLKKGVFELSDYHWSFTRRTEAGVSIAGYDPEKKQFYLLTDLFPFSPKKAFGRLRIVHASQMRFPMMFSGKQHDPFPVSQWMKERKRWIEQKVRHGHIVHDRFLKNVYESGNNPFLLPLICGLPVKYMESFHSHPVEWQFYIWSDCFQKLEAGKRFSVKYIVYKVEQRLKQRDLLLRHLPLHEERNWEKSISSYLQLLAKLSYVRPQEEGLFIKIKEMARLNGMENPNHEVMLQQSIAGFLGTIK